jgi:hypothetical protein
VTRFKPSYALHTLQAGLGVLLAGAELPRGGGTLSAGCRFAVSLLPRRLQWAPHNIIAHPVSELIFIVTGNEHVGNAIHDATLPFHKEGEGRG